MGEGCFVAIVTFGVFVFSLRGVDPSLVRSFTCHDCLVQCNIAGDNSTHVNVCWRCLPRCTMQLTDLYNFFNNYQCRRRDRDHAVRPIEQESRSVEIANETTEMAIGKLLRDNRHLFVSETELANMTQVLSLQSRAPTARVGMQIRPVCPTLRKVISPRLVEHKSGRMVPLISFVNHVQSFFVGECRNETPEFQVPNGRCKTETTLHSALFQVPHDWRQRDPWAGFRDCQPFPGSPHLHYCKDWVKLNAACSLFIARS